MLIPQGEFQAAKKYHLPMHIAKGIPFYADFACNVLGMNKNASFSNPQRFLDRINALWQNQHKDETKQFEKTGDGWKMIKASEIKGGQEMRLPQISWAERGCPWSKKAAAWVLARNRKGEKGVNKPWSEEDFNQASYASYMDDNSAFVVNFDMGLELMDEIQEYANSNGFDLQVWKDDRSAEDAPGIPVINVYSSSSYIPHFSVPDVNSNKPEDRLIVNASSLLVKESPLFSCISQTKCVYIAEMLGDEFDQDDYESLDEANSYYSALETLTMKVSPLLSDCDVQLSDLNINGIQKENVSTAQELIKNIRLHMKLLAMNDCGVMNNEIVIEFMAENYESDLDVSGFVLDTEFMIGAAREFYDLYGHQQDQEERFIPVVTKRPTQVMALVYAANQILACMKKLKNPNFQDQQR